QQRREVVEAQLAEEWASTATTPLYVDGGIGAFGSASRSDQVIGVVKSHRTLYGTASVAAELARLPVAARTSGFTVSTRNRTPAASWSLGMRAGDGDPLAGVVRVEVAQAGFSSERADAVSSWILREREPIALPDPRWKVMAYGVRECEEYLRATL